MSPKETLPRNDLQALLAKLIEHVPVFTGFSPTELLELLSSAEKKVVKAGQEILRQGDSGRFMYVLIDGQVRVSLQEPDRFTHYPLGVLGRGDCFGEMALVDPAMRSATVEAVSDCILLRFQESDCWKQPAFGSKIYRNIAGILAKRLREAQDTLLKLDQHHPHLAQAQRHSEK